METLDTEGPGAAEYPGCIEADFQVVANDMEELMLSGSGDQASLALFSLSQNDLIAPGFFRFSERHSGRWLGNREAIMPSLKDFAPDSGGHGCWPCVPAWLHPYRRSR